jgi:succinyl-CoA synthetase beta subunit
MALGREILAQSNLAIISAEHLDDAARLVVNATKEN